MILFSVTQPSHAPPGKQLRRCPPYSPAPLCRPCCPSGQAPRSRPARYKDAQLAHLVTTSISQYSSNGPVCLHPHPKDASSHRDTPLSSENSQRFGYSTCLPNPFWFLKYSLAAMRWKKHHFADLVSSDEWFVLANVF